MVCSSGRRPRCQRSRRARGDYSRNVQLSRGVDMAPRTSTNDTKPSAAMTKQEVDSIDGGARSLLSLAEHLPTLFLMMIGIPIVVSWLKEH